MAYKISLTLPPRAIHYVLCAAFESSYGAGYWTCDYSKRVKSKRDEYRGVTFGAPDKGAQCDIPPKHREIGPERLAAALSEMLASGPHGSVMAAARLLDGTSDARDADVILQFAVFGRAVYG